MRKAALYVQGRIVIGDSHLEAYQKLTVVEQFSEALVSGFFDSATAEFSADCAKDHFFNKEIFLIRHSTVADPSNPDTDLSMDGVIQAEALAHLLLEFDLKEFDAVTSPLLRCLQTASILADTLGKKFRVDPQLAESPDFLDEDEEFCVPNRRSDFPNLSWPESLKFIFKKESPRQFVGRSLKVLNSLAHKTIVITHYGLICNMMRLALCDDRAKLVADRGIPPASVTYINQQELQCLGWNNAERHQDQPQTSHSQIA